MLPTTSTTNWNLIWFIRHSTGEGLVGQYKVFTFNQSQTVNIQEENTTVPSICTY